MEEQLPQAQCHVHAPRRIYPSKERAIQAAVDKGAEDPERSVYECTICNGWHLVRRVRKMGKTGTRIDPPACGG